MVRLSGCQKSKRKKNLRIWVSIPLDGGRQYRTRTGIAGCEAWFWPCCSGPLRSRLRNSCAHNFSPRIDLVIRRALMKAMRLGFRLASGWKGKRGVFRQTARLNTRFPGWMRLPRRRRFMPLSVLRLGHRGRGELGLGKSWAIGASGAIRMWRCVKYHVRRGASLFSRPQAGKQRRPPVVTVKFACGQMPLG